MFHLFHYWCLNGGLSCFVRGLKREGKGRPGGRGGVCGCVMGDRNLRLVGLNSWCRWCLSIVGGDGDN
jgi:hypothetical protein